MFLVLVMNIRGEIEIIMLKLRVVIIIGFIKSEMIYMELFNLIFLVLCFILKMKKCCGNMVILFGLLSFLVSLIEK